MVEIKKCRVCEGQLERWDGTLVGQQKGADVTASHDFIIYPYKIRRCKSCGLLYAEKIVEILKQ